MPKDQNDSLISAALREAAKHQTELNNLIAETEQLPERWKKARLAEMMNKELDDNVSAKADGTQPDDQTATGRFDVPEGSQPNHYEVTISFVVGFSHTDPSLWSSFETSEYATEAIESGNYAIQSKRLHAAKDGS